MKLWVYNLGGLLILYMIFCVHLKFSCGLEEEFFFEIIGSILCFFMAWFFYKSGFFFKDKPIEVFLKQNASHLIVPYIYMGIISIMIGAVSTYFTGDKMSVSECFKYIVYEEAPQWNLPLWFLPTLFAVKFTYLILNKMNVNDSYIIICSVGGGWILSIYSPSSPINFMGLSLIIPNWIGNIFLAMAFYALGHFSYKEGIPMKTVLLSFVIYVIHFFYPSMIDFRTNHCDKNYFFAVVFFSASIILFNYVFERYLNKRTLLTHIGKFSIIYYVCHYPFIKLCTLFLIVNHFTDNKYLCYVISLVCCAAFLVICDVFFRKVKTKWIVGL